MDSPKISNVWIPVCCERVMRYNVFRQKDGIAYGSMVCTVCNKNVTFELEPLPDIASYGEGARILNRALKEARAKGFLGRNILGSGYDLEIYVHRGAGA